MDRQLSPDQRADLVEAQLTQPEKLNLVTGVGVCASTGDGWNLGSPRLGLPDLKLIGAGMGVTDVCDRPNGKATELPAPIAMAASWSPEVAYQDGALIGTETRDSGFDVALGGDVNLARDPRNGRTFEAEGEDPFLAGTIVAAQLRGTQSRHIPATIKHFALNNEEANRLTASSDVDERTMRELELRAFQIGIERSGVSSVMCSYNQVNGTPACSDRHLLSDILKGEWGFRGWVMSDWWACGGVAGNEGTCQTADAANAGLDQEQPNTTRFGPGLEAAIASGAVAQARLDDMVHRILRSMFASGLMDDPPTSRPIAVAAGASVAERAEERSAVLLKNGRGLLPLQRGRVRSIAVIGAPANAAPAEPEGCVFKQDDTFTFLCSSGRVNPIDPDTPLQGISGVDRRASVSYNDGSDPAAAAALARSSDVAIVYARDTEAEGHDRPDLSLDGDADALIAAVADANPRTVVVLLTGSAVTMPWLGKVRSVLEAWYPGERGGHAIAHLLFGDVNPSGRLPLTFPARQADLPTAGSAEAWPGDSSHIVYSEHLLVGYRWYQAGHIAPLFPFGYGLSYGGRFSYSKLSVTPTLLAAPAPVDDRRPVTTVAFTLTNTGTRTASEVPQVYTGLPAATGEPPLRLAGYRKLTLAPGHSRRVRLTLGQGAFDYWENGWKLAPGDYSIRVGSSSAHLPLTGRLVLTP